MFGGLVTLEIKLPVAIHREGDVYVARCLGLDVFSQGDDEAEALKNVKEAVFSFVTSCYDRGVLDQVLRESGFKRHSIEVPATPTYHEMIDIPIPLYMIENTPRKTHQKCPA